MKGTQECGFFFFFFFVCSERVRGNRGGKVPTWGLENCDLALWILQHIDNKNETRGGKKQGERETEKQGERRASFERHKWKRGGFRCRENGAQLCSHVVQITHTELKSTIIFLLWTHRQWGGGGGGVRAGHRAPDSTINRESSIHIHSTATAFSRYTFTHGFSSPGQRGKCMCRDRPVGRWRGQ